MLVTSVTLTAPVTVGWFWFWRYILLGPRAGALILLQGLVYGAGRLIQRPAQGFEPGSPAWKAGILPPRQLAPRKAFWAAKIAAIARVRHKCKRIFRFQLIFDISLIVTTIKRFFFLDKSILKITLTNICAIYVYESNHKT